MSQNPQILYAVGTPKAKNDLPSTETELLEILKEAVIDFEEWELCQPIEGDPASAPEWVAKARAAIAEAEGE